jgi:AraC-like DNA-binding protein
MKMDYSSADSVIVDKKPLYHIEKLDPSFPLRILESEFKNFNYHWHEVLEVLYLQRGGISLYVEGEVIELKEGDIAIINPNEVHGFFGGQYDDCCVIFLIGLDFFDRTLVDLQDKFFHKLVFDRRRLVRPVVGSANAREGMLHAKLLHLLQEMSREYFLQKEGYRLALRSEMYEFALIFVRDIPERIISESEKCRFKRNHEIMERVFEYVFNNAGDVEMTLEGAANAANMSLFYFTRFFKRHTGQTFHDFVSRLRVDTALRYLVESDIPVTDIAELCGFSSLKTFHRQFKNFMGISPTDYRSGKKGADHANNHKNTLQTWSPMRPTIF